MKQKWSSEVSNIVINFRLHINVSCKDYYNTNKLEENIDRFKIHNIIKVLKTDGSVPQGHIRHYSKDMLTNSFSTKLRYNGEVCSISQDISQLYDD